MRHVRGVVGCLASAVVLALSSPASAQDAKGFALSRFDPADRGSEWFMTDSLDLRGHVRPAIGVVADWGHKPLVVYNPDGSERAAIVQEQIFARLGGSIVFWDRLRAGLDLPVALYQTGDALTQPNGLTYHPPDTALGDLRLTGDVRLLGQYGDVFTIAAGLALYLPTGSRDSYTSDNTVRLVLPRVSVAGDIPFGVKGMDIAYAGRAGVHIRPLEDKFDTNPLGSEILISASAGLRALDKKLVVGPEIFGSTQTDSDSFFKKRTTPLEYMLGAHYTYSEFRFGGGVGGGLTKAWGTPVVRIALSAEWVPGADRDTDGDGILDSEDACPTVKGIRTNNPRTNGCPPPPPPAPSDRDHDGIYDENDACPDVPGLPSVDPRKNGCPPDRDNDGIPDIQDACPDIPGVPSPEPAKNGCPPDRDGDGIADAEDACPDVPGVRDADPKKNGCPPDRDGDGILDKDDACPDAPGPADPDPKKNGCPLARIEEGQIKILQQVKFKFNSADIEKKDSQAVLDAVTQILKDHPEITHLRIEGHTDNKGNPVYNKGLSERRAASVVKWLTSAGIDKKRLESKGFGMERPIDTNDTDDGRANNRRVEFHIDAGTPPPAPPGKK